MQNMYYVCEVIIHERINANQSPAVYDGKQTE